MPDYSTGKVYSIRCRTDTSLIYVGSTINPLYKRWGEHKRRGNNIYGKHYNFYIYTTIRNNGGFSNFYIELYESYSCENREELHKREGEVIRLIGNLNSYIAGRSVKEYREEHKEELLEKGKIYREEHKEELKQYREEHKEERTEKRKIKYTCECGSTLRIHHKLRHENSKKHLKFIENK